MTSADVQLRYIKSLPSEDSVNNSGYGSSTTLPVNGGNQETVGHDNIALELTDDDPPKYRKSLEGDGAKEKEQETDVASGNCFTDAIREIQNQTSEVYKNYNSLIWTAIYVVLAILYIVYLSFAMAHSFGDEASIRLLVCSILVFVFIVGRLVIRQLGNKLNVSQVCANVTHKERYLHYAYIVLVVAIVVFIIAYIIADIALSTPRNLISLSGLAFYIIVFFIFSYNPAEVKWRPVFWGLVLQFFFALLILRWSFGYQAFKWLGERVSEFLLHTDAGSSFLFGATYKDHEFAFRILTVIIFFSMTVSVLYYLGIMQFIIRYLARFMSWCLGTSPTESLNAAGNIFIGQSEAPLLIRPFLAEMTNSELHAVLTGGFATIAGSVMAAYISFDVPANHLLSASVMSAPAALAMSKLMYPETKKSKADAEKVYQMEKSPERNVIEAASNGATQSAKLIANIAVNLIAFIAALEFVNLTLKWFGERVGLEPPEHEHLTFQFICSYVFYPLALFMGVDTIDCRRVAEMIGIKTFVNEFVAYLQLSTYVKNRQNLTWYEGLAGTSYMNNGTLMNYTGKYFYSGNNIVYEDMNITLENGILTDRSVVIATYSLCGFSNISSMGIMLGALGAMAPTRKTDLSRLVLTAMIAGNVACFMTACIAGLLYEGEL